MQKMIFPLVAITALLAIGTYYQGFYSERWIPQSSEKLDQFTKCLARVPMQVGSWEGKDQEVDPEEFKKTNCTAYVSRGYENTRTGDTVSLYLVSGTARHCTIHSPDWCYQGAGYKMQGEPELHQIPIPGVDVAPEFSTAVFLKQEDGLRIYWTYADDGKWQGPKAAKRVLAGKPALYKMYLIGPPTSLDESPVNEFAKLLFPKLNPLLFPSNSKVVAQR